MAPRDSAERCRSSRLLWGVAFLFAFALIYTAVSALSVATPGLQLEDRSTNTSLQRECVPVRYDDFQHSTWGPDLHDQLPEYVFWQVFCITNSTANFTVNFNPAKWSRQPYDLSYSEGRYHYNKTLPPYVTEDGRVCVNASLIMFNLTGEIDYGDYKINVSTDCSSSEIIFQVTIDKCGPEDVPRPIQPTLKPLIVPEVNGQGALTWAYHFFGDSKLDYTFRVTKSGEIVCDERNPGSHFNCTRNTVNECNITITARIQNYTHKDSGNYCAAAYPTGGGYPGKYSCLKFVVVQQPVFVKLPKKRQLDFKGTSLAYLISNYSEYVNIAFVKDERKIIDTSGNGYELDFQYDPIDNTTVTVTLHMTGKPQHAGEYTLCTSVLDDTSTRNCTKSVSVGKVQWNGEVVAACFGALIPVAISVTLCCLWYWHHRKKKQNSDDVQRDGVINGSMASGAAATSQPDETTLLLPPTGIQSEDAKTDSPLPQTSPPVWQQLPADIATRPLLNDDDDRQNNTRRLQKISEKFTDWRCLARYLRYEQHTINEIDEDHRTSAERKYHMLYKWAQRQGDGATPKALLQCVEFELLDRKQAQSIVDAILDL